MYDQREVDQISHPKLKRDLTSWSPGARPELITGNGTLNLVIRGQVVHGSIKNSLETLGSSNIFRLLAGEQRQQQ